MIWRYSNNKWKEGNVLLEIKYENIKFNKNEDIFVDVRSPKEFHKATIPGAINIPIFNNEERELIGTLYKQESVDKAKKTGIDIASKKLPAMYEKINNLNKKYNHIYMFCSRGGFRSSTIVPFFNALHISISKVKGGYKAYRAFIREALPKEVEDINLVVLYGNTGTGKTHILDELRAKGMNVLDLEGCANHRGSILGSVGLGEPNSQKMFESLLYEELESRNSNLVFTEGESKRIGRDIIPKYIFKKMKEGKSVKITAPMEKRIQIIREDYVSGDDEDIIEALNHMRNRFGDETIDEYINLVKEKDYDPIIKNLITSYYDPLYKKHKREHIKTFENIDSEKTAENIIDWVENPQ